MRWLSFSGECCVFVLLAKNLSFKGLSITVQQRHLISRKEFIRKPSTDSHNANLNGVFVIDLLLIFC